MKRTGIVPVLFVMLAAFAFADTVDAKRLGGGRSVGTQRQSVAPPAATPPGPAANPVMPAQPGAGTAAKAATPAAPVPSGASRWLGPLAGIAAGLGLAALLSHFGLPEGFASVLLLALVVFGVVMVARIFLARRALANAAPAYAGVSARGAANAPFSEPRVEPVLTAAATPPSPAPSANFAKPLPAGFDAGRFLEQAKLQFGRLQAAWDQGDRAALADVMTPEMMDEIGRDLAARGEHRPTQVDTLNAEILEVTTETGHHWASVRFTGLVRDVGALFPEPLDEVWNLTKPVDGSSGWRLAGIRQIA